MTVSPRDLPKVLFVCVENSNRSQMAEAFARIHGADIVRSYSAGSRPSGTVNPRAIEMMRERGYELATHTSKSLNELPPGPYAAVVTMGCGDACPWIPAERREDWDLEDPKNLADDGFRAVRDDIERRVIKLLNDLKPALAKFQEPISRTLKRTVGIAVAAGLGIAASRGQMTQWYAFALVALWFTFGGHWVEVFYLNALSPRLNGARTTQYAVRITTWFFGGVVLGLGATFTAHELLRGVPTPPLWLFGVGFVVLEILLHSALSLRAAKRPAGLE